MTITTASPATLTRTSTTEWTVTAADGTVLVSLSGTGSFDKVHGPASAPLVADHGYPSGRWAASGPDRYQWLPIPRPAEVRFSVWAAFADAVIAHYLSAPATWDVVKIADRVWAVSVQNLGVEIDRFTTRRDAQHAITDPHSRPQRLWRNNDAWYNATTTDPRLRALTDWEHAVVAAVRACLSTTT